MVEPSVATARPNPPFWLLLGVSVVCSDQLPESRNTYAALPDRVPMTAVLPWMSTDHPNPSPASRPGASSRVSKAHAEVLSL